MLNYDQIVFLIKRGIVSRKHNLAPVEYAYDQGLYMGCPGKEIHDSILQFTPDEQTAIMNQLTNGISTYIRVTHMSVFWRYFFGVQDRNGSINNKIDVIDKLKNIEWREYNKLMDYFLSVSRKKNKYAYLIASEMYAHRLGDQYLLTSDSAYLDKMIELYNIATALGEKLSAKNSFSAPCWCCCYLFKSGHIELCKSYGKIFLNNCNKYCCSKGVKNKMLSVVNILYNVSTKDEWETIVNECNTFTGITHKQWVSALHELGIKN